MAKSLQFSSLVFLLWSSLFFAGECSKILMLPVLMKSHLSNFVSIAESLVHRGHDVDIVVTSELAEAFRSRASDQLNFVLLNIGIDTNEANDILVNAQLYERDNPSKMLEILNSVLKSFCPMLLMENEDLMTKLENNRYDMALVDALFTAKCMYLIPHRLGIPFASLVDEFEPWLAMLPWSPSFVPASMLPYSDNMNFKERLANTAMMAMFYFFSPFKGLNETIKIRYERYGPISTLEDIMSKSRLWLFNADPALGFPVPLLPNVIQVGGLTTAPAKPLNKELQAKIDSFPNGFVLISFGSAAKSLPPSMTLKILNVLDKFDVLFIWRIKASTLTGENIPANVHIMDWLPQNDLLGNPKIRAFVAHCGKNGLFESLYHGVPIVGTPLWGDQPHYAKVVQTKGYGETVDLFTCSQDDFELALRNVLEKPSYKNNIALGSKRFLHRTATPADRAAHWTEHVLEYGDDHLRTHSFELPWYQYFLLDVLALVLLCLTVILYAAVKMLRCVLRICFGAKQKEKKN